MIGLESIDRDAVRAQMALLMSAEEAVRNHPSVEGFDRTEAIQWIVADMCVEARKRGTAQALKDFREGLKKLVTTALAADVALEAAVIGMQWLEQQEKVNEQP